MCLKLGIDDPVAWFDSVPTSLVNAWMAYYTLEPWEVGSDLEEEEKEMLTPDEVLKRLQVRYGG